jgi:hypothetical protein
MYLNGANSASRQNVTIAENGVIGKPDVLASHSGSEPPPLVGDQRSKITSSSSFPTVCLEAGILTAEVSSGTITSLSRPSEVLLS